MENYVPCHDSLFSEKERKVRKKAHGLKNNYDPRETTFKHLDNMY